MGWPLPETGNGSRQCLLSILVSDLFVLKHHCTAGCAPSGLPDEILSRYLFSRPAGYGKDRAKIGNYRNDGSRCCLPFPHAGPNLQVRATFSVNSVRPATVVTACTLSMVPLSPTRNSSTT